MSQHSTISLSPGTCGVLSFPNVCAAIGGASTVRWTARFAWISIFGERKPIRLKRSALPNVDKWTSFNLGDAARAVIAK